MYQNIGGGQNTDPQSMDCPHGLPIWTTLKWTTYTEVYSVGLRNGVNQVSGRFSPVQ